MTIRAVIVDDEELARRGIRTRLERAADVEIVAECSNCREAIDVIRSQLPDLVFLDVQMPGKTGFDVIQAIGPALLPQIIFVTAHDDYAIRAFEVNALDYLLKPIDDERFDITLKRARESLTAKRERDFGIRVAAAMGEVLAESRIHQRKPERIVVRSGGRVVFVQVSEIDWVEAAGDYVSLHVGDKSWLLRETIGSIEKRLAADGFARIHRSTIVNAQRIVELKALDNGEYLVLLQNGAKLKLSRSYRHVGVQLLTGHS